MTDDKKDKSMREKIKEYVIAIAYFIVIILVYFSFSGFTLYLCKLAQSNIMPTDINCFPYENYEPEINPIRISFVWFRVQN